MNTMLRRMKLWQKFAALGVIASTTIAVPLYTTVTYQHSQLAVARNEAAGLTPLLTAFSLQKQLQSHRGLSGLVLTGKLENEPDRRAAQVGARAAAQQLAQELEAAGFPRSSERAAELAGTFDAVSAQVQSRSLPAGESFTRHTALVEQTLRLMDSIADESGLSLDPVAESYYIMTAVVDHLPRLSESMAQLRGRGAALLARGELTPVDRASLDSLADSIRYLHERSTIQLEKAAEIDPGYGQAVTAGIKAAKDGAEKAIRLAREQVIKVETATVTAGEYFKTMSAAQEAQFALLEQATGLLREVLQERIAATQRTLATLLASLAGLMLLGLGVGWAVSRSVTRSMQRAIDAARAVSQGDLSHAIDTRGNDEIAQLLCGFKDMQASLRERNARRRQRSRSRSESPSTAQPRVTSAIGCRKPASRSSTPSSAASSTSCWIP
jgi:methyl-accepting chemotaxis protein